MFVKLQSANEEIIKSGLLNGYEKCSFEEIETKSSVSRNGKTWVKLGTVSGKLNDRALIDLKIHYWMKVILTLGLALIFSPRTRETGKTLKTHSEDRQILVNPQSEKEISAIIRGIFSGASEKQGEPVRTSNSTPLVQTAVPPLSDQQGSVSAVPLQTPSQFEELKKAKVGEEEFKSKALEALARNSEEEVKYIFETSGADPALLADLAENAAKTKPAFFKNLNKDTLTQLATQSPRLLNVIPNDTPNYLDIAKETATKKFSETVLTLDPDKTKDYKEIVLTPLKKSRDLFQVFLTNKKDNLAPNLLFEISVEAVKVGRDPLAPLDVSLFPANHPRFKEFAVIAVQSDENAFEELAPNLKGEDYIEVAARAVIAATANNWKITVRPESFEDVQKRVSSLKEIDIDDNKSILNAFQKNPEKASKAVEDNLAKIRDSSTVLRKAFEANPQVAAHFSETLIKSWVWAYNRGQDKLPQIPIDLPNYEAVIVCFLKHDEKYASDLNYKDQKEVGALYKLMETATSFNRTFVALANALKDKHPNMLVVIAKFAVARDPNILDKVTLDDTLIESIKKGLEE